LNRRQMVSDLENHLFEHARFLKYYDVPYHKTSILTK